MFRQTQWLQSSDFLLWHYRKLIKAKSQVFCFTTAPLSWQQGRKEKSKYGYVVRKNLEFDRAELLLYEPVEKMPPFSRKTLVFVSPPGIPKQSLVHKLVDSNHDMFGRPIPCKLFWHFMSRRRKRN